ncbi:MAG TPA: glycosyltransferase family 4 protein [Blastocatellia bacterium]|nr:glycosyltransferase family 4 protein [Blastocatellia bacterium]
MNTSRISIVIALAFVGSLALTAWVRRLAIIDVPNERSSHSQPTPRGGGLAVVVMTFLGLLGGQFLWSLTTWQGLLFYLGAASLIAVVSWWDDVRSLSTAMRFLVHFLAAGLLITGWGYWDVLHLPGIGQLELGLWGLGLTLFWIVGLTNAYNFMDGIDGIAGGQALVAGVGWAMVGWKLDNPFMFALGGLVAASSLGFLVFNWAPAKIFMGDVGSAFLGFTFAVAPLMAAHGDNINRGNLFLIGFLLLWPFIVDTGFTLLRRLSKGENIFRPHRSHFYQRMVIAGYSHQVVSLLYIGLAIIGSLVSLLFLKESKVVIGFK